MNASVRKLGLRIGSHLGSLDVQVECLPVEPGTLMTAMRHGCEEARTMYSPLLGSLGTQTRLPSAEPLCQQDCS